MTNAPQGTPSPGRRLRAAWSGGADRRAGRVQRAGSTDGGTSRFPGRVSFRRGAVGVAGAAGCRSGDADRVRRGGAKHHGGDDFACAVRCRYWLRRSAQRRANGAAVRGCRCGRDSSGRSAACPSVAVISPASNSCQQRTWRPRCVRRYPLGTMPILSSSLAPTRAAFPVSTRRCGGRVCTSRQVRTPSFPKRWRAATSSPPSRGHWRRCRCWPT